MSRTNRRFTLLTLAILAVFAGYTGFWFYAKDEAQRVFDEAVAAARARGETLEFESAQWGGFPVRLSVGLRHLKYRGGGYEAEIDDLQAEVLPWDPTRALISGTGAIRLAARQADMVQWLELRPANLMASLRFHVSGGFEGADLELKQVRADGTDFDGNDIAFNAARLQFDIREATDPADAKDAKGEPVHDSFQLAFSADALAISEGFAPALGSKIGQIRMAAWAKHLPRMAPQAWTPSADEYVRQIQLAGGFLEIARLDFDWGGVTGAATGKLNLDKSLRPEGQIDFRIKGLAKLIKALTDNRTLKGQSAWLQMILSLPGPADGWAMPLRIQAGRASFGPFDLGDVPRLD